MSDLLMYLKFLNTYVLGWPNKPNRISRCIDILFLFLKDVSEEGAAAPSGEQIFPN